ncbi:MAG: hypothetical protein WBD41_05195 [Rhodococcus sp. (in: high G+C Gram-positive bacteria)]|jgi:indole-3-acetate monooxygenase|uniref:hypothetical protein n=1 Tax=Rhodococcus sp. EPR-157 TaxID=1813677 RepID=UPI0007BBD782|nr:hypothetical protein [Rhodococcus sp. EPR-157]KZF12552.1 hypothetical protein A2J03_17100 [Rhodococcus sp. EPR-157]
MTTLTLDPIASDTPDDAAARSAAMTDRLLAEIDRVEPEFVAEIAGNEEAGRLSPRSLDLLRDLNIPLMMLPEEYGGYGMFPIDALPVLVRLARIDSSIGWIGGNWSCSGVFLSYLESDAVEEVLGDEVGYFGVSGAPTGTARITDGGYVLSGKWGFGSGNLHAAWVLVNARVLSSDGSPVPGPGGGPTIATFLVPGTAIESHGNWDVIGLRGTGSVDFSITEQFVPNRHRTDMFGPPKRGGRQISGSFLSVLPLLHTSFALGTAEGILRDLGTLASTPNSRGDKLADESTFRVGYARQDIAVASARALVYEYWREVDHHLKSGAVPLPRRTFTHLRQATVNMHDVLRDLAVFAFKRGSGTTLHDGPLQRRIRDALAGCQHLIATEAQYVDIGWELLGAPPNRVWGDRSLIEIPG